jgi:hypothetical protein
MEYMTIERASKKLHMEKAEFIGAAIEHDIWIGIILGPDKIRFFKGCKLQPFLARIDTSVSTEKLQPLYVEYPDPDLAYMPTYDYLGLQLSEISLNNMRIPYKELDKITPAEAPANNQRELLEIKPGVMGVKIDAKALFYLIKNWWLSKR